MKVLIFGATGQVGSALASELAPDQQVVAITREQADFMRPGHAADVVTTHDPDVVINAAAWTAVDAAEVEPESARRVNAGAVKELAGAAHDCWLVHYSTDYVFDGENEEPYLEDDVPRPLNVYGQTKLEGERAVLTEGGRHLVLRTSWVHAPGHRNFAATILRLAAERESLSVVEDQIGIPTSAGHIARVTRLLLQQIALGHPPDSGVYHLAAGGSASWYQYARFVLELALAEGATLSCGPKQVQPLRSDDYPQNARRPRNSRLSTRKLERFLNRSMPDWQVDVRETVRLSLPEIAQ